MGFFRKRLMQWLGIRTININTIVQQNDPHKYFISVKVVGDVYQPDERFDLIFNLAMVTVIHGIRFKDIDQDYSYIKFINGDEYYAPFDINDFLEMLDIDDYDDDDDDDDNDDEPTTDDPPELTKKEFEAMINST